MFNTELPEEVLAALEPAIALIREQARAGVVFSKTHGPGWAGGQYIDRVALVTARANGSGYTAGVQTIMQTAVGGETLERMRVARSGRVSYSLNDLAARDRDVIDSDDDEEECDPVNGIHVDGCERHCYDGDHCDDCRCECDPDHGWHHDDCEAHCFDGHHGDDCDCDCDPDADFHNPNDCDCDEDDEDD